MKSLTFHTIIYLDDEEVPVEVDFNYWPPSQGHCDRFGVPEEPDDPAELEILTVRRYNDNSMWDVIEVPKDVMKQLESEAWDAISQREVDA